jgi:hypothetical protein
MEVWMAVFVLSILFVAVFNSFYIDLKANFLTGCSIPTLLQHVLNDTKKSIISKTAIIFIYLILTKPSML